MVKALRSCPLAWCARLNASGSRFGPRNEPLVKSPSTSASGLAQPRFGISHLAAVVITGRERV